MSVQIDYNKHLSPKNSVNKVLFVDEKYKILSLKKYLSNNEYKCISDLLKSKDIEKKILSFDINSKVTITLVSLKSNIKTSELENLGGEFYDNFKKSKIKNFNVNSDTAAQNKFNIVGYFIHGIKLKSYKFEKYKTKKNKEVISINLTGKNIPSAKDRIKFEAIEKGTFILEI